MDQRGNGFVTMLCDSMAGGMGAKVDGDGVDTGGQNCIPMGRVADVEINEFSFPMLYLWRREEADSGGPGRWRGGVGASSCFVPHDSPAGDVHLVVSANGKAVPQSPGLAGGYPAATQWDVLVRDASAREQLADGRIPQSLDELGGTAQTVPPHLETDLGVTDVYFTHWQGGGGLGDPLHREPERVAADVAAHKVSEIAAPRRLRRRRDRRRHRRPRRDRGAACPAAAQPGRTRPRPQEEPDMPIDLNLDTDRHRDGGLQALRRRRRQPR